MTLSNDLWQANQDLVQENLEHPFIRELSDGSLARERFAYYVGQDAFFLQAFARAYTVAGAKAPDWEGFRMLHVLADGVLEELKLHGKYAAEWGVDLMNTAPTPATRQYTDFVLATAWACESGVTVVALSPCMRLYAYLGQQLAAKNPTDHAYIDWIRTYSSEEIENLARQLEHLADTYASDTQLVRETYRYAMICERDFFQAAYDSVA
jgi:thiaminase (transcriptional activator TenA)